MNINSDTKLTGTIWVVLCYFLAIAVAWLVIIYIPVENIILKTLVADVVATVVVFLFSTAFRNASFYDPFWSVAPVPIAIYWQYSLGSASWSWPEIVVLVVICLWSIRLTLNWYRGWQGLYHEDWRYTRLKKQTGLLYPLVNLTGIHLFPTLMVFLGCLPLVAVFDGSSEMNLMQWFFFVEGLIIGLAAPIIQFIADEQMRSHRLSIESGPIHTGLWRYSRHPNYFGELLFWLSIVLFGLSSAYFEWWMASGIIAMWGMFRFISIPMMEKRILDKYPSYEEHQANISTLLPWPRRDE